MHKQRREFIKGSVAVLAASAAAGSAANAAAEGKKKKHARAHAYVVPADTENRCATCTYWGGQRHVTPDRTAVHVKTLGMCNNPASPNFHTITSPDTGPMKAWVRWPAVETG